MNVPAIVKQLAESAPDLLDGLLEHPLARRLGARIVATGDNRIYTAEDVIGERIMRMAGLLIGEIENPGSVIMPLRPGTDRLQSVVATTALALSATPYLWTEEVRHSIRDLEVPRHVISPRLLPQPRTWHTFETGIGVGGELHYEGRKYIDGTVDAMLVCDSGVGLEILQFGEATDSETGEVRQSVTGGPVKYGLTFPDDLDEQLETMVHGPLVMFSFLASRFIPKTQRPASRAARREARRLGHPVDDELVTFVVLRRPVSKHHKTDQPESVEWKHRWLVNGHLRAQWYPSEQAHHLIWIAPYLKGPEDAPMLQHAYKVAQ